MAYGQSFSSEEELPSMDSVHDACTHDSIKETKQQKPSEYRTWGDAPRLCCRTISKLETT